MSCIYDVMGIEESKALDLFLKTFRYEGEEDIRGEF